MSKGLELTQSQVKRVMEAEKGETIMLMFPILLPFDDGVNNYEYNENCGIWNAYKDDEHITSVIPPIQKGDKDIEFYIKSNIPYNQLIIGKISECIDVSVVRVQDILELYNSFEVLDKLGMKIIQFKSDWNKTCDIFKKNYNNQLKEQNINRTYEDNDYVFLMEVRK